MLAGFLREIGPVTSRSFTRGMGATNSRVRQLHTDCSAGNTGSAATILRYIKESICKIEDIGTIIRLLTLSYFWERFFVASPIAMESEGNVDINSVLDDEGETALQKAAKAGHLEVLDLLLQFEGTPALEINKV